MEAEPTALKKLGFVNSPLTGGGHGASGGAIVSSMDASLILVIDAARFVRRFDRFIRPAFHFILPGTPKDLGYLASLYCPNYRYWKDDNKEWGAKDNLDDHLRYNCEDAVRTFYIYQTQKPMVMRRPKDWAFEMEKDEMAFEMMQRGVRQDLKRRAQLTMELGEAALEREMQLLGWVPQCLIETKTKTKSKWYSSPSQQKFLFGEVLGIQLPKHRKTKKASLDKESLPKIKEKAPWTSPICDTLMELRQIDVFSSTFLNAPLSSDRRMRTSYGQTETYRWSSSINPLGEGANLQNIPKGNESD